MVGIGVLTVLQLVPASPPEQSYDPAPSGRDTQDGAGQGPEPRAQPQGGYKQIWPELHCASPHGMVAELEGPPSVLPSAPAAPAAASTFRVPDSLVVPPQPTKANTPPTINTRIRIGPH